MTVNYGGGAGNIPRLFIPSMGQVQDPAVQRALQQIKQWSDSLEVVVQLLAGTGITLSPVDGQGFVTVSGGGGGTGSLTNWGFFNVNQVSGISNGSPMQFTSVYSNNFAYLSGGSDFSFPTDTLNILLWSGFAVFPSVPIQFGIIPQDAAGNDYGLVGIQNADTSGPGEYNVGMATGFDTVFGTQPLRYLFSVPGSTPPFGPTNIQGYLFIASFTRP